VVSVRRHHSAGQGRLAGLPGTGEEHDGCPGEAVPESALVGRAGNRW
jgi:hypothetical protein